MKSKYLYIILILTMIFSQSCDDGYEHYDGIYMSSTLGNNPMVTLFIDEDVPKELNLSIASTALVTEDVTVELTIDPRVVAAYNKKYGTAYEVLPAHCYVLSQPTVIIEKGSYANSIPLKLSVISLEGTTEGAKYMVPVSIKSVSGGHNIIEASRTIYAAMSQIIIGPALRLEGKVNTYTNFTQPAAGVQLPYDVSKLPKVSMEARVFIESYDESDLNTIFGLEENFVVRISNERGSKGQLELTGGGIGFVQSTDPFPLKRWTHLAVVYDGNQEGKGDVTIYVEGEVVASVSVERKTKEIPMVSLHAQYMQVWGSSGWRFVYDAPFYLGHSEKGRYLHGSISEAKIWAKALSNAEVKTNMCITDPTSENLVAYWRFNDGGDNGTTYKDLTGHGFDMRLSESTSKWTEGVKCPEN